VGIKHAVDPDNNYAVSGGGVFVELHPQYEATADALHTLAWTEMRDMMNLQNHLEPFVQALPDARQDPFSGVWYNEGQDSEAEHSSDAEDEPVEEIDFEAPDRPRRLRENGVHMASADGRAEVEEEMSAEADEEAVNASHTAEAALPALHASAVGGEDESDADWINEMCESPSERRRRYLQSTQDEVSDPDEWADLHYGPASSRSRPRSADQTPVARSMPAILAASRDRRLAIEQAEAMVCHAEEDRERRGVRQVIPSACSSSSMKQISMQILLEFLRF
jgi:hypothetical protein